MRAAAGRLSSAESAAHREAVVVVDVEEREMGLTLLSGRLLFGALVLVMLVSPFEAGYPPLGRFLWATFTNLEACLFLLGGAWLLRMLVSSAARKRLARLPLLLPVLALVGAAILSTLLGEFKTLGVQFVYRLLMGILVYASVWEALRGKRRIVSALAAFVAAGFMSAIVGMLEFSPWFNIQPWLRAFKPQPTTVGGMLRLSGTFEYANGAAIYFEMLLPIAIGLALLFSSKTLVAEVFGQGRVSERVMRAAVIALMVATGMLAMALVLTFSRAAWAGLVVAASVMVAAAFLRRSDARQVGVVVLSPLLVSLLVAALGAVYVAVTQPLIVLRLTAGENDRNWYRNSILPGPVPPLTAGDSVIVPVTLRNEGPMTWQAERVPSVHLSYHWRNAGEDADTAFYAVFNGERTVLPHDVGPGESVSVEAILKAPPAPGEYLLEWDLVQENVTWFYEKSKVRAGATLHTVGQASAQAVATPVPAVHPPVSVDLVENSDTSTVPRRKLWSTAFAMFRDNPITGVGPDGFRNLYGKYAGVTRWSKNIYTNNTYIEMFTNLGIVGGLAFLLVAGLALWRSARNILRERAGALWVVGLGAAASLTAFFFHGLADYFLFATPIYIIFWFTLGISVLWPRLAIGNSHERDR